MTNLLLTIPVACGGGLAAQSAINSRLAKYVKSPYLSSLVSFFSGWLLLLIAMVVTRTPLSIDAAAFHQPWWIWLGGVMGVFGMTSFILLFPVLGSVQTSLLAIGGQIIMGVLVDQFGWFSSPVHRLNFARGGGIIILCLGMLLANYYRRQRGEGTHTSAHRLVWQALAVVTGMVMAVQSAINGHLGSVLHSSLHAVTISFTLSLVLLNIMLVCQRISYHYLTGLATGLHDYWWLGCGGLLGVLFSFSSAWLVPIVGTGSVVVCSLFGQLAFSAVIDEWGLFAAQRKPVTRTKMIGIVLALMGVVLISLN